MSNPFTPGIPATGNGFIDRKNELALILEHTRKGISSAIVGNPHIGKTSLLARLLEPETFTQIFPDPKTYTLIESDFHLLMGLQANTFWRDVLQSVISQSPHITSVFQPLLETESFNALQLNRAFRQLAHQNHRVILLIDEFDALLGLEAFNNPIFLGALRTITSKSRGLILITTSRESIAEMNELLDRRHTDLYGSKLLNYLQNVSLGSLPQREVTRWLGQHFNAEEVDLIEKLAGQHPYLVQIAGDLTFTAKLKGTVNFASLYPHFIIQAEDQFNDVWNSLNAESQIALVIFTLDYLSGKIKSGESFSLKKVEKQLTWYSAELKDMARRGTIEIATNGQYKIDSLAFLLWIVEHKIEGTRGEEADEVFEAWLSNKEYKLGKLITKEQLNWLNKNVWQKIPDSLVGIVRKAIS